MFAVVSTKAPHATAVYELSSASKDIGLACAEQLAEEYTQRISNNDWLPIWSKGVVEIDLPKYRNSNIYQYESNEEELEESEVAA